MNPNLPEGMIPSASVPMKVWVMPLQSFEKQNEVMTNENIKN
jgi:hypothetical protein